MILVLASLKETFQPELKLPKITFICHNNHYERSAKQTDTQAVNVP
jgi:hypothetical protein